MIGRIAVILASVTAGAVVGALVFRVVGEERIGSEVTVLTTRLGFKAKPGDDTTLKILERIAPGTQKRFEGAVIGTVVASLIAATAATIAVREVVG